VALAWPIIVIVPGTPPDTPYAPPAASVSDPVAPAGPRPRSIRAAVSCLWVSAGIVAVAAVFAFVPMLTLFRTGAVPLAALAVTAVTIAVSLALLVLVAVKLNAGRGWVRWLYLALYALGLVMILATLLSAPEVYASRGALSMANEVAQFLLQTAALVLMFVRPSREWLAAQK